MVRQIEIEDMERGGKKYAVCTLVTDYAEYQVVVSSFVAAGFTETDTDFFYIDNQSGNKWDAFSGFRQLLSVIKAEYVIFCHQDIMLNFDDKAILEKRMQEIDLLDSNWAVLGNAGGNGNLFKCNCRISDPHGENTRLGQFPAKVRSLDENFLLLKRKSGATFSHDLAGFHFYGTDLCLNADILGFSSYVIDFHLSHRSGGDRSKNFLEAKKEFLHKYQRAFRSRFIKTTCARLFLSGNRMASLFFNLNVVINFFKKLYKWNILK